MSKPLHESIHLLQPRSPEPQWFHEKELIDAMMDAFHIPASGTVIEVGSWMGDSSAWFAGKVPSGTVYCVDSWDGPIDGARFILSNLYQQFLSNMVARGISNITPVRMKSIEAAMALNVQADVIYLDADHSAVGCYEDILMWMPHLKPGGMMCGDDYSWHTVGDAVQQAAQVLGKQVGHGKEFWWFQSALANNDEVV